MWPPDFLNTAELAAGRVRVELSRRSPLLGQRTTGWLISLGDIDHLEHYFTHPQAVPILALPWWLETSICGKPSIPFQSDLMYSTINGYYFTRMLDDVMDGHGVDPSALPALYHFHTQFQSTYSNYFGASSSFWAHFERMLMDTAEAAAADYLLGGINEESFSQTCARKSAAGAIPMAAVCYRYDRPALLEEWESLFRLFGRWHQMRDDLFDWSEDRSGGRHTWLLSEAERQRSKTESVPAWMGHRGFSWASEKMEGWMEEIIAAAIMLDSLDLVHYLEESRECFRRQVARMVETAAAYSRLLELDTIPPVE